MSLTHPDEIALVGWADRAAVLGSPKVRLVEGGPGVYVVGISEMRPFG